MTAVLRPARPLWLLCAAVVLGGCSTDSTPKIVQEGGAASEPLDHSPCLPDESAPVPSDRCTPDGGTGPTCGKWIKVELPGTVCGDGSQYKIFVNYSNTSNDLVLDFEPGGACWDYASCAGKGGVRGAANPHGIPDDHMALYQYLNLLQRSDQNPARDYNMVFVPYCTGDIHSGNNVITYSGEDDAGMADTLTFHHAGHANTLAVIDWVKKTFEQVPKLLVTG